MARLHHRGTPEGSHSSTPEEQLRAISDFLRRCRKPAVLEAGDNPLELRDGNYSLEIRSGKLSVAAWSDDAHFCRRIVSVGADRGGVLDCASRRFGGKPGKLSFLDLDRPQAGRRAMLAGRQNFAEQFRHMLFRAFPRWEITTLSSTSDLQRSFSGLFPRARLARGQQTVAAIACASEAEEPAFLTSALIWYDHVRSASRKDASVSLQLFLPEGAGALTAQRLKWLRTEILRTRIFLFNEHGSAGEVDPEDLGNIETRVSAACSVSPSQERFAEAIVALRSHPDVSCHAELSGALSLRFRGIEFARVEAERFLLASRIAST